LHRLNPHHVTILAVVLLIAATLFRLGLVELRGEEPRRAVIALEMLNSGEYIVPHMSGHTYFNKPPLFNWAVATSLYLFGGTEAWMVRLPSLVAFWLTGLFTFLATYRFVDRPAAIWATLFYLTCGELLFYGTVMTGELDLFFSLIVFLQASSILVFLLRRNWSALFVVSYGFAAIGFLTKGMPSVAFQGLTLVATLIAFGSWKRLFDPRHLIGLAVFGGLIGGYFYLYSLRAPVVPFLVSLVEEASQRTAAGSRFSDLVSGSVGFPLVVIKLLLPWSLLIVWLFRRSVWRDFWENPWTKFCLVFCAVNMPLYWFSGELRNRYVYPFFPFVLIPLARVFSQWRPDRERLAAWTDRIGAIVLLGLVVGALVVPWIEPFRQFDGVLLSAIMWAIATAGLLAVYRSREDLRIPVFALALVVTRLAFDVAYLPAMNLSRVSGYPPYVEQMVQLAEDEPVHLAGSPQRIARDASIGPIRLGEVEYTIPPSIAYQIPWHYARLASRPMVWREKPDPGDWCLIDKAQVDTTDTRIRLEFRDHWTGADLALVRWRR
jgi:4-amino-4-deoxy-L-arabinose transferase-like glycosyltransferase